MTIRFAQLTLLAAVALLDVTTARADEGHIAIVEDTDGAIAAGLLLGPDHLSAASCAFYKTHQDAYDALFVFTTDELIFLLNMQLGWAVKLDVQGIGRQRTNESRTFCSGGRLRHAVKMGDISALAANPDDLYPVLPMFPLTGMELMAHEFGHHWMANVRFDKGDGVKRCLMRGFEPDGEPTDGDCDGYTSDDFNWHWSYYYNSGSVMYGSAIKPLSDGEFELSFGNSKYSELDQYLMGLRSPDEVPPQFLVQVDDLVASASSSLPPPRGSTERVSGTRVDFTIDDIIRAEGPRVPAEEPCHWTAAFMIVHPPGSPPTPEQIAKVDRYRQRWQAFYREATDWRGSMDTTLDSSGAALCLEDPPGEDEVEAAGGCSCEAPGSQPYSIPLITVLMLLGALLLRTKGALRIRLRRVSSKGVPRQK